MPIKKHFISKFTKVSKKLYHLIDQSSRGVKLLFSLVVLACVFLVLPNIKGGLKVLGFIEKDFLVSTSGALYETNSNHFFRALIGSSENASAASVKIEIEGESFELNFLDASSDLPVATQKDETQEVDAVEAPPALIHAESELALVAQELEALANQTAEIKKEVASIIGSHEQTFFGPFEKVVLRTVDKVEELSYYLDDYALVETWQLTNPNINSLKFAFSSTNLTLKNTPSQEWQVFSGDKQVLTIKTQLVDAKGDVSELPLVDDVFLNTNTTESGNLLILPNSWISAPGRAFPVKVVRTFVSVEPVGTTVQARLKNLVGEDLASSASLVSSNPKFITLYNGLLLYWSEVSGAVSLVQNGSPTTLFTDSEITGLSCQATGCITATKTALNFFDPIALSERADTENPLDYFETWTLNGSPIGGLSTGTNTIVRTSFVSPTGAVYKASTYGGPEETLFSPVQFPSLPAVSPDGNYFSFWAEGKLHIGGIGQEWQYLPLPFEPKAVAIGNNNIIYFIATFEPLKADVLVRVTPGLGLEVLSKIHGSFSSITVDSDNIYLGVSFDEHNGAIVLLPQSQTQWNKWINYDQN